MLIEEVGATDRRLNHYIGAIVIIITKYYSDDDDAEVEMYRRSTSSFK